jgi:hypothetical protein
MQSIVTRLDQAISTLSGKGLSPVTIVLSEEDHSALAQIGDWPVTATPRGELRFRSTPVFKAGAREPASIVGRGVNGSTHRINFDG